mmetsp:Transcript_49977/g.99249  ORF Transcript_49977/g.99249 Transcript_49977/m.99249 type:complete len:255 (+) Transcript_49977:95-859(+)
MNATFSRCLWRPAVAKAFVLRRQAFTAVVPNLGSMVGLPACPWPPVATSLAINAVQHRYLAAAAGAAKAEGPQMSAAAAQALGSIKETMARRARTQPRQLSKSEKRSFPGCLGRYRCMGGRPEFHNIDRNRHGRIFEPWHTFEIKITSSKNNCHITVKNKGWKYRSVIASHAGNVGFRAGLKKSEAATHAIASNIARKLKRLGVTCAEVKFRKIMKVETCLQAFQGNGLQVTRLTHEPRLPKGHPCKPRKQRRV